MGYILYEIIMDMKIFDNNFIIFYFIISKKMKYIETPDWINMRSRDFLILWIDEIL
jgi:hypothetical protein